jgi:hypothetical protein
MSEETMQPDEHALDARALEERSRALFHASVERLDAATRSRLTQARHAALEAARHGRARRFFGLNPFFAPAAGVAAAAVLAVALWLGSPLGHHGVTAESPTALEDLDLVASDGSGEAMEMLQEDPDFYAWADKAANTEPEA